MSYAIVDNNGDILLLDFDGKVVYAIFKLREEAEEHLKELIDYYLDEVENIKEYAKYLDCKPEDFEEYLPTVSMLSYLQKCSVKKVDIKVGEDA